MQNYNNFSIIHFTYKNEKGKALVVHDQILKANRQVYFSKDTPNSIVKNPVVRRCFGQSEISLIIINLLRREMIKPKGLVQRKCSYLLRHPKCMTILNRHFSVKCRE